MAPNHYNYIISGAGCAGLSLLMRMMDDPFFAEKKILVIDQSQKNKNDRTWCFWEDGKGLFNDIVHHQWEQVHFYSPNFHKKLELHPYQYKMIQGLDFYEAVIEKAAQFSNITFRYETILGIQSSVEKAELQLNNEILSADYVFNSIVFEKDKPQPSPHLYQLKQHFKGWVIETEAACFDASVATLMDFRTSQTHGTSFFYVMPTSTTTALVEYTLFSEALLPEENYDHALKNYIQETLGIAAYQITHTEFGEIPMTNQRFSLQDQRIIQMGVAGGQVKGSSGYAFQFIQKRTAAIVAGLKAGKTKFNELSFAQKKGQLYDAVLLQVLQYRRMPGDQIFSAIFSKNKTASVLRFLDNESSFLEDLKIMYSVPTNIFLPAAFKELSH